MKKTAQTGQSILTLLHKWGDLTTEAIVEELRPRLSHVRDPQIAVRSALSKLKIAGRIERSLDLDGWHVVDDSIVSRGGSRAGSGRRKRSVPLVALSIKIEKATLEAFKAIARESGATLAGLFTCWVKNGCPVR